jgi:hypothetical protein
MGNLGTMPLLGNTRLLWLLPLALFVLESCSSSNVNDGENAAQGGVGNGGSAGASGNAGAPSGGTGATGGSGGSAGAEPDGSAGTGGSVDAGNCRGKEDRGACKASIITSCPAPGQELEWLCVDPTDGTTELRNASDNRIYWCDLVFDNPNDSFDCKTNTAPGLKQAITSGGNPGGSCPCESTVAIGVPNCSYDCQIRE